jgi:multidrug resistance protein MdtO
LSASAPGSESAGRFAIFGPFIDVFRRAEACAETLVAELDLSLARLGRATRQGLVTAAGAALLAAFQIANPLGLTLIFNFSAAESALDPGSALLFIVGTGIIDVLALPMAGATVDMPGIHLVVFFLLAVVSSYAIYADRRVGRLWIWAQLPVLSAYYMMLYEPYDFGVTVAWMWSGCAAGVALLLIVNKFVWPADPTDSLMDSIAESIRRSSEWLERVVRGDLTAGRLAFPGMSRLGRHLELLQAAAHRGSSLDHRYSRLRAVVVCERLQDEIAAIGSELQTRGSIDAPVAQTITAMVSAIQGWSDSLSGILGRSKPGGWTSEILAVDSLAKTLNRLADDDCLVARVSSVANLLVNHRLGVNEPGRPETRRESSGLTLNRFMARFSIRHSIALLTAFVMGLIEHDPAMHAALWLLMIGGPPSHGATVRKFSVRLVGAAIGGLIAIVAIVLLSPNFTQVPSYVLAIFIGTTIMAYIGQGGGLFAYISIGGTVFLIALSGVMPRDDVFASLWTIWGIMLGMAVRAIISMIWREHPSRTLVEQFEPLLEDLRTLVAAKLEQPNTSTIAIAADGAVHRVTELLAIVHDTKMEGRTAEIEPSGLLSVLESLLSFTRIAIAETAEKADCEKIFRQIGVWCDFLRRTARQRHIPAAPLRTMIRSAQSLIPEIAPPSKSVSMAPIVAQLIELENRFEHIWADRR